MKRNCEDMSICTVSIARATAARALTHLKAENEDLIAASTSLPGSKAFSDLRVTDKSGKAAFGAALQEFEEVPFPRTAFWSIVKQH